MNVLGLKSGLLPTSLCQKFETSLLEGRVIMSQIRIDNKGNQANSRFSFFHDYAAARHDIYLHNIDLVKIDKQGKKGVALKRNKKNYFL